MAELKVRDEEEKADRFENYVRRNPYDYQMVEDEDGEPIFLSKGGVHTRVAGVVRILSRVRELNPPGILAEFRRRGKPKMKLGDMRHPIRRLIKWGFVEPGTERGTFRLTRAGRSDFAEFHRSIRPTR